MHKSISPTPWVVYEDETIEILGDNELSSVATMNFEGKEEREMATEEARVIVLAVNNTYGSGINPEAVPELFRTLTNMCDYFEWLTNDPKFLAYREAKEAINKAKLSNPL